MQYHIQTHGCQMNYSDSERIETYLNNLGFKKAKSEKEADLFIFNSCSVKQKAEDKVIGSMEKLIARKRKNPNLLIALTGCMIRKSSTRADEKENRDHFIKQLKHLDIAFRIEDLPNLRKLLSESCKHRKITTDSLPKIHDEELADYFHINPAHASKAQVFIPVSTGCDKFCTYCIVPFARGREVSRNLDEIIEEATQAVEQGALEITLLGQTVDSYGLSNIDRQNHLFDYDKIDAGDQPPPFVQLLTKINALHKKGLKRIRFTSPHPKDVSPELIESYATLETLMPHIHLPIQSGDNSVLQRMNRPYTIERYKEIVTALRKTRPDIAITTDMIIGFCGETEEEFQNTLDLYKELDFDFCYSSRYSNRKGTHADKNLPDDISRKTKAERWHRFNDSLKVITQNKLEKYIGQTLEVLIEEADAKTIRGKSPHNKTVQFPAGKSANKTLIGTIQKVLIKEAHDWILFGDLV
ncbi:tRNA (N6-isopentenyl adenosine(37)-C2)-methylthiotransferase MiaB [Candidatus Peregrinibacteria bacterium]|nr:tRNA (N6-isopentenyl adenosine(37)-C2)-methylthiotransferase MiaB [Candidatus Peregrinibacteria bacterium]